MKGAIVPARLLVPLLCFFGAITLVGCWGSGTAEDKASREDAFREVIGFAPPQSVTKVESAWYFMRESYVRWLRFSSDDEVVSKILSLKEIRPVELRSSHGAPGDPEKSHNPNAPHWWRSAALSASTQEFEIDRSKPSETDRVHLWIDRQNHVVYASRDVFN